MFNLKINFKTMLKTIKQHLEDITTEKLEDFKHEMFIPMASCSGDCGNYSLGINGNGMYAVKANNEIYLFQSAAAAVERYRECASD